MAEDEGGDQREGDDEGAEGEEAYLSLEVEGETRRMTRGDVQKLVTRSREKEKSWDTAKRERADALKQSRHLQQIVDDVAMAQKGNAEAARRLSTYAELGISPDVIEEAIRLREKAAVDGTETDSSTAQAGTDGEGRKRSIQLDDLPDNIRRPLEWASANRDEQIWEKVMAHAKKELDKDEDIRGMIQRCKKASQDGKVKALHTFVGDALRRRAPKGLGPHTFEQVTQEAKAWLKDLGILYEDKGQAPVPSVGASSVTGVLSSFQRSEEPPKRVSARKTGDYSDWVHQKILHALSETEAENE